MTKLEKIESVFRENGWEVEVHDDCFYFRKNMEDEYEWESQVKFEKDNPNLYAIAGKLLNYAADTENAETIKTSINNFNENFSGEYDSINELCDELEKYGFYFEKESGINNYYLHLNGVIFGALQSFKFKEDLFSISKEDVQKVINYLKKYNARSFATFYVFPNEKEKENYKYMYNHIKVVKAEFKKLFRIIDEIVYS